MIWLLLLFILLIIIFVLVIHYLTRPTNVFRDYVYLDNNATTEMSAATLECYALASKLGNISANYAVEGRRIWDEHHLLIGRYMLRNGFVGQPHIVVNSGASESNANIIEAVAREYPGAEVVMSSYEHNSLLGRAKTSNVKLILIEPDNQGRITAAAVMSRMNENTKLVSIIHAHNELGIINDIAGIAAQVKQRFPNVIMHSDMVQSFGKLPTDYKNIDAISMSYHKIYGPIGCGMLICNDPVIILIRAHPLIFGSQNEQARGGTVNIAAVAAARNAFQELSVDRPAKNKRLLGFKKYVLAELARHFHIDNPGKYVEQQNDEMGPLPWPATPGLNSRFEILVFGQSGPSSPGTLFISVIKRAPFRQHFCNIRLKEDLLAAGCIVSIGSACNTDSAEASHVLYALKLPFIVRCGVIRISFGDHNTHREISYFTDRLVHAIKTQS